MTETRTGFEYEILPRLEKPDLSDEGSVPEDAAATNENAQQDNHMNSMSQPEKVTSLPTENEKLGIEAAKDLALEDGNSIAENVQSQDAQPDVSSVAVHESVIDAQIDEGKDRLGQPDQYKEQLESEERHSLADGEINADPEGSEPIIDHLLVTVKAPQTVRALQGIAHRITKDSSILFLQNGMGIIDEVNRELFPDENTRPTYLIGVVSHGIYSKGMFSVVHAGEGTIALGVMPQMPMSEQSAPEKLTELPASARYIMRTITRTPLFVAVGFQPTDLLQQQLDKIAVNCIINPLTAIFNIKNGDLLHNFSFTRVIRLLLAEISIVIRNLPELKNVPNANMRFDSLRLERLVFSIANSTAANTSSMLQDLQANKRTEIDYINGYIVKRGEEMGLHCVMNYMIVHMIKAKRKISQKENGPLPFEGFGRG